MTRVGSRPNPWLTTVPAGLLYGSVALRAELTFRGGPELTPVLGLLAAWLVLLVVEPAVSQRWPRFFALYLALQTVTPLLLIGSPSLGEADWSAVLVAILSMQVMQRLPLRQGIALTGVFTLLVAVALVRLFGIGEAIGHILIYAAANALLGSYALAIRRTQEARDRNRRLAAELEDANRRLREASARRELLAATRARHELARELHDSVTQTVFSMILATESALLLLGRDPGRVEAQLDHLTRLAQSALSQMQALISELRPEAVIAGGLPEALRRHLDERQIPDSLAVSLEVEGDGPLLRAEERGLYAIAREALNNTVKHAQASNACIRLHLLHPHWMEVTDDGRGFEAVSRGSGAGVGVVGMHEQAAEIGWDFALTSAPGAGTRIRVGKKPREERPE